MSHSLTIAHLSDFHISAEHKRLNIRNTRRVLEHIVRLNVAHLVLTGDVTADARPKDFEVARSILSSYGFLNSERLTVIIGNHDIFGGVHTAEDLLTFPGRCRATDYEGKVRQFMHYFPESFERCMFASPGKPFPFAKVLGNVVLIGMNSVAPHSHVRNPIGSNGEVGRTQFKDLEGLLSSPLLRKKKKIVLIHHHFFKDMQIPEGAIHGVWAAIERQTMKLRGKKELLKLFKDHDVNLVLHGHLHESSRYVRKGIRFLNAGGSVLAADPQELNVNLVKISGEQMSEEVRTFRADTMPATNPSPIATPSDVPSYAAA